MHKGAIFLGSAIFFVMATAWVNAQVATVIDGSGSDLPEPIRIRAVTLVSESLKDPMSAQLRRIRAGRYPESVCGEVNAKSEMGGYVGFSPFYVLPYQNEAFLLNRAMLPGSAWGIDTFRENGCL